VSAVHPSSANEASLSTFEDGLGSGLRPMRADAVKNRRLILEAAEAVFAEQGVTVPVDLVAERAGVGVGTLYRNFPTKEALFEAIVVMRLTELAEAAEELGRAGAPGEAFFTFLRLLAERAAMKRDLFAALATAGIDIKSQCSELNDRLQQGVQRLLERAQEAGEVRGDVDRSEAIGLVVGTCMAADQPSGYAASSERMLEIIIDGLRRHVDETLP
jgi:AcrR family transcriptional regulator